MQKAFYSEDLIEFKVNHKWIKGNLKDIKIDDKKFILSLENEPDKLENQSEILLINNYNAEKILKNSGEEFSEKQRVEFFDESSNGWAEGKIKTRNNDFYLISYTTRGILEGSKILYKNDIRTLTNNKDILKVDINYAQCFSLKKFENLCNPMKYAKKFIKKLINLLNEKIFFIFLNNNFDLFIFSKENKNENLINTDVINGLVEIAVKHFENIDKANKKLFK